MLSLLLSFTVELNIFLCLSFCYRLYYCQVIHISHILLSLERLGEGLSFPSTSLMIESEVDVMDLLSAKTRSDVLLSLGYITLGKFLTTLRLNLFTIKWTGYLHIIIRVQ